MGERPQLISDGHEMRRWVRGAQQSGQRVGFVPTMGCLHAGHLSLVRRASEDCQRVVASIFVNPTQFGPHEDFGRYPRQLPADLDMLSSLSVDAVFAPSVDEMYPAGYSTYVEPPAIARRWEGECRPGHFRGVATVVLKLFQMVPADASYFGHKDFQQARVIECMVRDLNVPMEIHVEPTVREPDGLALSSRNAYLSEEERHRAVGLWRTLQLAQQLSHGRTKASDQMLPQLHEELGRHVDQIEYIAICDVQTLEPVTTVRPGNVVLIAARLGSTRLIDNLVLS